MKENMGFDNVFKKSLEQKGFIGADDKSQASFHNNNEINEIEEYEPDIVEVLEAWKESLIAHGFEFEDLNPLEVIKSATEKIENYRMDLAKKRQEVGSMSLEEQGSIYEEISDKIKKQNELIQVAENFLMINGKYFKKD